MTAQLGRAGAGLGARVGLAGSGDGFVWYGRAGKRGGFVVWALQGRELHMLPAPMGAEKLPRCFVSGRAWARIHVFVKTSKVVRSQKVQISKTYFVAEKSPISQKQSNL